MITQQDLQGAIAECIGERNPNANTCIKLAAYYTIQREMYGEETVSKMEVPSYSFAPPPEQVETTIDYESDTEFGRAVEGKRAADVWPIMDELMDAVSVLQPRLYASVMSRI